MKNTNTKKSVTVKKEVKKDDNKVLKIASFTAGAFALAAAGYYFFGPDAKKNQKKLKGWTIKMKGEVVEKLEKLKEVTEPVYNSVVDTVAMKYAKLKDEEEVTTLAKDLKKHWKSVTKDILGKKSKK
jgi:hypothetical protein